MPHNYFNYFTEIEDAFIRRRAKHLLLSPMDWALIESWKEMNVPLHIVLRGIEKSFDSWEAKPRRRTVKSLLYCQEEVEALYAEWLESRVGAASEKDEAAEHSGATDEGLPFPRQAIVEYLARGRASLRSALSLRRTEDDLTETVSRVIGLLLELERDFAEAIRPDARQLETSLTGLERMLSDGLLSAVPAAAMKEAEGEVKEQLRTYRSHMEKAAYDQTFNNLLLKRLREQFGMPRLSLFYL